jgi:hypothetical protein
VQDAARHLARRYLSSTYFPIVRIESGIVGKLTFEIDLSSATSGAASVLLLHARLRLLDKIHH